MYVSPMWAQVGYYFGQNKVLYKDFEWAVLRTEHFDVHYYPEEEQAARDAARMAERAYQVSRYQEPPRKTRREHSPSVVIQAAPFVGAPL